MSLQISELTPAGYSAWDEFVNQHPQGSPFHLTAWMRSIEETFGYRPMSLMATDGSRVDGVLPLFLVSSLLTGKALISSPFAVYGGILASDDNARSALAAHLSDLANRMRVGYAELRNAYPEQRVGFAPVDRYVTFTQDIVPDDEALLELIPRKTRRMVRKALALPYTTRMSDDYSRFEDLYLRNLHRLGTPSFPARHFSTLRKHFGKSVGVREVILEGKVVAAVMNFYFRDQVLPYYGAADPAYNESAPSNFMYYDLMRWAAHQGYRLFDFGRSKKESGSYHFKEHWGMTIRELPYEMLLVTRKELPNLSPNNPKFEMALKVWKSMPYPVTRVIGPHLVRLVP
jgi:FemAB-related protein (PEP-CTERM system-associated)